jgi:HD-GYP domain-containing protein (c-di-GMP phosphodiesterase class II)
MIFLRVLEAENSTDNQLINIIGTQLLQVLRSERNKFIGFILGAEVKGFEMAKSSVNTAILSGLCALELKLPHHRILAIIIGALLHDIGMLRLPIEIIEKRGGLSEAERLRMRSHPLHSQRMVMKEFAYPDEIGEIVLQHHERWDGEGYPYHIAGENIELGARIVSIADAFEAMVSPKPYRSSIVGNQAIKNLLADNSRRFDPEILKVFITTIGIYPIGSIIQLNNGIIARVSETRAEAPLRPKMQVLVDEAGKMIKNEDIIYLDLFIQKNLYITKTLGAKEFLQLQKNA